MENQIYEYGVEKIWTLHLIKRENKRKQTNKETNKQNIFFLHKGRGEEHASLVLRPRV